MAFRRICRSQNLLLLSYYTVIISVLIRSVVLQVISNVLEEHVE